jgi:hypothetical protein
MSLLISNFSYPEITDTVINNCISDIDFLFENKKKLKLEFPQQTQDILFDESNPIFNKNWELLKSTFLKSVEEYSNKKFNNCKAWVFGCFPGIKSAQYDWHVHPNANRYTGVMYLSLPEGCNTTEFLNENNTTFFLPHIIGEWFIFEQYNTHRNGYWDYDKMNKNRYCLAASVI